MARHFLRLKLALLGSGFKRSWQQAVGLLVGLAVALPLGAAAGIGIAVLGRRGDLSLGALSLGFGALLASWALIPLIAFGIDETFDPARLRLLPLTRRQLFVGLSVTSLVGVAPVATALALTGVAAGLAPLGPGAVVVVLAVVAHFALCILASRALTTALASRLRSRRARDAVTFLFALLGVGAAFLGQLPRVLIEAAPDADLLAGLERWGERASLLPSGWAARAALARLPRRSGAGSGVGRRPGGGLRPARRGLDGGPGPRRRPGGGGPRARRGRRPVPAPGALAAAQPPRRRGGARAALWLAGAAAAPAVDLRGPGRAGRHPPDLLP